MSAQGTQNRVASTITQSKALIKVTECRLLTLTEGAEYLCLSCFEYGTWMFVPRPTRALNGIGEFTDGQFMGAVNRSDTELFAEVE